jgi:hypothetical protein
MRGTLKALNRRRQVLILFFSISESQRFICVFSVPTPPLDG